MLIKVKLDHIHIKFEIRLDSSTLLCTRFFSISFELNGILFHFTYFIVLKTCKLSQGLPQNHQLAKYEVHKLTCNVKIYNEAKMIEASIPTGIRPVPSKLPRKE